MPPERDHPLARGRLAQAANDFLARAWTRNLLPPPVLDPQTLWALACRGHADAQGSEHGGRDAADVADFRERLERLCAALRDEAQLNALGQTMAFGQLLRTVRRRLALGALWRTRPDLIATPLAPPIIVVGHMRSGTTRVHNLLAADPAHSFTRYRDAYHPVPSRINRVKAAAELAMLGALNPWMQSIHPMAVDEPEEELAWISAALHHSIYETQWHIPGFSYWSEARDPAPIYREFARILRTDANWRGNADKPRVLKVPAFTEDLDTLLQQFPDARLVLATRDLDAVLRSAVSLAANHMAMQSDACDLARIEAHWQRKIALREERMAAALARWHGPVARLGFDELNADWERAIARCYAELKLDLTEQALAAMRRVMEESVRGKHRDHARQLARFSRSA